MGAMFSTLSSPAQPQAVFLTHDFCRSADLFDLVTKTLTARVGTESRCALDNFWDNPSSLPLFSASVLHMHKRIVDSGVEPFTFR